MTITNSGIILIVDAALEQTFLFKRQLTPNRVAGQYERAGTAQLEQLKAAECPILVLFAHPSFRSNWIIESLQCDWGISPDRNQGTRQLTAHGAHLCQHWGGWVFCFVSEGIEASKAIRLQKILAGHTHLDSPVMALSDNDSDRNPIAFPQSWGYRLIKQQALSWLEHGKYETEATIAPLKQQSRQLQRAFYAGHCNHWH